MKKALSCILVLALFLSLGAFGGWGGTALADTPEDRVGTYVMTDLVMDGENYTQLLADYGEVFTLELLADGTGTLTEGEDVLALTWDESYIYDDAGIPVSYTFEDGTLIMTEGDMVMTFQKLEEEELPEKAPVSEQSIVGTWVGAYDIRDYIVQEDPDLAALMENTAAAVTLDLREDGSYTLYLDASPIIPSLRAALYAYVGQLCEENGITLEEFEEASGSTVDELVESALAEFNVEEINETLDGTYELVDGELLLDGGTDKGIYTGDAIIIDIDETTQIVLTRGGIVGLWVAEMDMASFMGDADEGLAAAMDGVTVPVILDLRSDNSFTMTVDVEAMLPALRLAMTGYVESILAESGLTLEQFESMSGQSLDSVLDDAFTNLDLGDTTVAGTYSEENGVLTLSADSGDDQTATRNGNTLNFEVESFGSLSFVQISNEDILAKGEGVMTYAEFDAAEVDDAVVIEAYLQGKQAYSAEYGNTSLYLQDADGAYFVYRIACTQEEYDAMELGRKLRISGFKSEWAGEVEIVDASFEPVVGAFEFQPENVTALLGTDELITRQNKLVAIKGAELAESDGGAPWLYGWDGSGAEGSDLYFNVIVNGEPYSFVVESDLCGPGTEVYETVKTLQVGDKIDLVGFLYWYEGPNPHIVSVTVK